MTFLLYARLRSHIGEQVAHDDIAKELLQESDRRVRRALKLVAFNFAIYISSRDPHQTYHIVFHLELVPSWPTIAVQRYGARPGPDLPELELSSTELDWLENGLAVAAFYHACAEQRLKELRQERLSSTLQPLPMPRFPFPTAVESALRRGAIQTQGYPPSPSPAALASSLPPQLLGTDPAWIPSAESYGALGDSFLYRLIFVLVVWGADSTAWAAGELEDMETGVWSAQTKLESRQHTSTGHSLLPVTRVPEPDQTSVLADINTLNQALSTSTYQTPSQRPEQQLGIGPPPSIYHPARHSTAMSSHRTDGFHLSGGLKDPAGVGGGVSLFTSVVVHVNLLGWLTRLLPA